MPAQTHVLTHRPARDGSPNDSTHIPFYVALEFMADAWMALLCTTVGDLLLPTDLAVVKVDCTFSHEVFVGAADIEARLLGIGNSSLTWAVRLAQGGSTKAEMLAVVARVDKERKVALPLSALQRAALQPLVAA